MRDTNKTKLIFQGQLVLIDRKLLANLINAFFHFTIDKIPPLFNPFNILQDRFFPTYQLINSFLQLLQFPLQLQLIKIQ